MVQRLPYLSPTVKGTDLVCDPEGGAPDDTAVNISVQVISGVGNHSSHSPIQRRLFFTFIFFRALNTLPVCNKSQLVGTASLFWVLLLEAFIFNVGRTQICVEDIRCI